MIPSSVRGRDESRPYIAGLVLCLLRFLRLISDSVANFLYCYPKTNTNMFVKACRLRKSSGDRRVSDSDISLAKAQRRQVRNRCHCDKREKSLFRSLDFFRDAGRQLGTFATWHLCERYSGFRLQLFANRRTSFSQPGLGKSVYYYP